MPKFYIHTNRELVDHRGRPQKFYSERDYTNAMKKAGAEPYDPRKVSKRESKPYERSTWANDMITNIHERRGRKPDGRFLDELAKRGYTKEKADHAMRLAKEKR